MKTTIAIASDHAGYEYKEILKSHIKAKGFLVEDFGTDSTKSVDYPDFIKPAAVSIASGKNSVGIIVGGSGNEAIAASLKYAHDVFANPASHTSAPYYTGSAAYDTWVKAVEAGHGSEHGNWWNATVWGECRSFASSYFTEISQKHLTVSPEAKSLSESYKSISDKLFFIANKELDKEQKIVLLKETKDLEVGCIDTIADVIAKL